MAPRGDDEGEPHTADAAARLLASIVTVVTGGRWPLCVWNANAFTATGTTRFTLLRLDDIEYLFPDGSFATGGGLRHAPQFLNLPQPLAQLVPTDVG